MAAVARSGPSEARTPCPVCGGLIHPIAGKCKHCKSDLRELRGPRTPAAAPLPSLGTPRAIVAGPHTAQIIGGNGKADTNGHVHAPVAAGVGVISDGTKPILPPRVTQQRYAASGTAAPERSVWRSWPVIVIILAGLAIIAAIILMVWPPPADGGKHSQVIAPPAQDRMSTDPLPPAPDVPPVRAVKPPPPPQNDPLPDPSDPWGRQRDPSGNLSVDPDPLSGNPFDATQIPDWNDLLRDPDMLGAADPKFGLFIGLGKHVCQRAVQCGNANMTLCDAIDQIPAVPMPACRAVQKCIQQADRMSCDQADPNKMAELFRMFADCEKATRC